MPKHFYRSRFDLYSQEENYDTMKKTFLLFLFAFPFFCMAQKGIHFEHDLTWDKILVKAQNENKYIFVDAFTTWCGPCKFMSANIFTKQAVGDLFNKHFVNLKVQLDTTNKDDEHVKSWYKQAHNIMTEYKVNVFPTFLIFDKYGKLVHRMVGSSDEAAFIEKGNNALNPENQYYLMLEKFRSGYKENVFLGKLLKASQDAYDNENKKLILAEYIKSQKDFGTKERAELIIESTESTEDASFKVLLENADKFDEILSNRLASQLVTQIIMQEFIFPKLKKEKVSEADWETMYTSVNSNYPKYAREAILMAKMNYFQSKREQKNYLISVMEYMKLYGSNVSASQLNEFAWNVFEIAKDETTLAEAMEWSKKSVEGNSNPMYLDTYANLLYKMGKVEQAIEIETKALTLAPENDKQGYKDTWNKMKKGEKTWKE